MEPILFNQLAFVRQITLKAVEELSEEALDFIPNGFNNNVKWNLGHIYLIQEKFAFHFAGEPLQIPAHFDALFMKGTKPAEWKETPPTKEELLTRLAGQPERIRAALHHRFDEPVQKPFTLGNGLTMSTIGEFLSFTLYHEGMHISSINALKRFGAK